MSWYSTKMLCTVCVFIFSNTCSFRTKIRSLQYSCSFISACVNKFNGAERIYKYDVADNRFAIRIQELTIITVSQPAQQYPRRDGVIVGKNKTQILLASFQASYMHGRSRVVLSYVGLWGYMSGIMQYSVVYTSKYQQQLVLLYLGRIIH